MSATRDIAARTGDIIAMLQEQAIRDESLLEQLRATLVSLEAQEAKVEAYLHVRMHDILDKVTPTKGLLPLILDRLDTIEAMLQTLVPEEAP